MAFTLRNRTLSAAALAATAAFFAFASPASAAGDCTKVAAPTGSDDAAGTPDAPFRTAQALAYSLRAGDVGCLRAGTYHENVELTERGTASAPIVLQSYPGERATDPRRAGRARRRRPHHGGEPRPERAQPRALVRAPRCRPTT